MAEHDEAGYYEIQLNNKQLVFFFMAAVATAVVVFLCGVMVGRGVRDATIATQGANIASRPETAAFPEQAVAAPSEVRGELDYQKRLESAEVDTALEGMSSNPEKLVAEATGKQAPSEETSTGQVSAEPSSRQGLVSTAEASGRIGSENGIFTIQVSALKTREAADRLVGRLEEQNYRAYVESGGSSGLHRVGVGWFASRTEAEKVGQRLREDWKFSPYITK